MFKDFAMFSTLRRRRPATEVSVGARYCRRDTPNIVWEVQSLFVGKDGMHYAGLFCVSDPTLRKTLSQSALQHDGRNARISDS
jgi:hypothetical protein